MRPIISRKSALAMVSATALTPISLSRTLEAQTVPVAATKAAPVPFTVGEQLVYRATFGKLRAGTARMRVAGIEIVRGRPAYHVVFTIDGGIPFFRVHDRYDSWIDVETLSSLRHRQQISEGRYRRTTTYEIYPEQSLYRKNDDSLTASVPNPLDDGSFIYAVRAAGVEVGETRREDRYFRPDRNPVVLTGVRRDEVKVPAGTFTAVVVSPTIRTKGIFSEGGEAEVWFSDDEHRYPLLVKSRFAGFGLTLTLQSITSGDERPPTILAGVEGDR
ncbi:MAG TPA: DUF3108 domain-containing protein [Gemmatimonadaceae bacterium]|jgi:hypothetical protein|nr:DUF3108 domain-containing protein [Gemmatimonadaceae bacterium]